MDYIDSVNRCIEQDIDILVDMYAEGIEDNQTILRIVTETDLFHVGERIRMSIYPTIKKGFLYH